MAGLQACNFLVVDSNPHMRHIIDTVLRGFGVRSIIKCHDVDEAVSHIQRTKFDVILTDCILEYGDGIALARQVRRRNDHLNRFTPMIMITAFSERPRIEAARDAGVNEVCVKPLVPKDLFRKLVAVADHPRPFVVGDTYTGPERRRRADPDYNGPERRATADQEQAEAT